MQDFVIRKSTEADIKALYSVAEQMKVVNEVNYFEKCFKEHKDKKREIFVIEVEGKIVGYAQLIWSPTYAPFKSLAIPEIQDINVVPLMRRQGFGEALIDYCENVVREAGGREIGIGFGLNSSFGSAQRLYIKKGYIPDGCGACYDNEPVKIGSLRAVDDYLTLKLTKELK